MKIRKIITISILLALSSEIYAHTNSIGFTSNGGGSASFWYGNWHSPTGSTTFNEGSISLVGETGVSFSQTQAFNQLTGTTPTGLIPGTNYFSSDGTVLVSYRDNESYNWQGATFTGLTAGTYRFTYIPISNPTVEWRPDDSVILSSTITLTNFILVPSVTVASSNLGNTSVLAAARVIDASSDLLGLFISLTTETQVSNALTQTLPLLAAATTSAVTSTLSGINGVVRGRFGRSGKSGKSSGDDFYGDEHIWIQSFGSLANKGEQSGVAGYKANTYGVVFGVDATVSPALRVGGAFAHAKSGVNGQSSVAPQNSDIDVYQLIGYGSYSLDDRTDISFQLDVGQNINKARRQIAFTASVASSEYDSFTTHIGAGIGRTYALSGQTSLTPSFRADYTLINDQGYSETGAGLLNLNVNSRSTESFVVGVDGKLAHNLNDQTTLFANLGVGYDTMSKQASITSAFAGAPGAAFVTNGIAPDPWLMLSGIGAVYTTKTGIQITGSYDAEVREKFLNNTASVKFRWAF